MEKSVEMTSMDEVPVKPGKFTLKKALLVVAGSASLALGVVGIFLPLLPTTPFLLLSAFCYIRSSERLYSWLINHRVLGAYIYNYMTYGAIGMRVRIATLIVLWLTLVVSMILVSNLYLRIFLVIVGIGVSIHLFTLKTMPAEKPGAAIDG